MAKGIVYTFVSLRDLNTHFREDQPIKVGVKWLREAGFNVTEAGMETMETAKVEPVETASISLGRSRAQVEEVDFDDE